MITAQIIADSINEAGNRLTTFECTYPRFIHSEMMTHRMLSKNSASSRAIPVEKMIESVRKNPAMFEQYGVKNTGMAAIELMSPEAVEIFKTSWFIAMEGCLSAAEHLGSWAAKQMVNRLLEPFSHMTIVVSGTEWSNFFALRAHPAAQPEFQVLAYRMLDLYLRGEPVLRTPSQNPAWMQHWHLPYVTDEERHSNLGDAGGFKLLAMSVARCARVSYTKHGRLKDLQDDIDLHQRLISSQPMHASPLEHQACAMPGSALCGNFRGWTQYRKTIPGENTRVVDLSQILADKPDWIAL